MLYLLFLFEKLGWTMIWGPLFFLSIISCQNWNVEDQCTEFRKPSAKPKGEEHDQKSSAGLLGRGTLSDFPRCPPGRTSGTSPPRGCSWWLLRIGSPRCHSGYSQNPAPWSQSWGWGSSLLHAGVGCLPEGAPCTWSLEFLLPPSCSNHFCRKGQIWPASFFLHQSPV